MRELSGSKGRAALGSGIAAIAAALLASLKTLDVNVAVALIITLGVVAVAYIWATGFEDGKKSEVDAEVEKTRRAEGTATRKDSPASKKPPPNAA